MGGPERREQGAGAGGQVGRWAGGGGAGKGKAVPWVLSGVRMNRGPPGGAVWGNVLSSAWVEGKREA